MLGGRYEVLTPIASGGMATVHLGRALGVGGFERLVAIKVMHPHIAAETDFINMFLDEARLAARIRHPNVVATIDVQADDGLFIVMEYVDGPSLQALRKAMRKTPVPFEIAARILVDSLAGLHAAHELCDDAGAPLNLVHRDISPANILIGADGVVRITDFGVARAEARLSSTRGAQVKGKVPYMPPEQLMGESFDRRCDIYAAGVVFWEMLTGQRLFQADNDGALVQKVITGPTSTPRQVNPSVPPALDAACMRALARAPADRFATAAEFADALEHATAEAKLTLASTRALARFVEESGSYEKLDPRRLAQLKQASESRPGGSNPSTPAVRAPSASRPGSGPAAVGSGSAVPASAGPGAPSGSGSGVPASPAPGSAAGSQPSVPSLPGAPLEPDPSLRSGVTATAATLSGVQEPPRRWPYRAMAVGGAIAVLGLVGGVVLAGRSSEGAGAGASATAATERAPAATERAPAAPASAPPSATVVETTTSSPPPGATTSASASASATSPGPKAPATTAVFPKPPPRPPPPPPPTATSKTKPYNPDRL